jgi:hypothetical protein
MFRARQFSSVVELRFCKPRFTPQFQPFPQSPTKKLPSFTFIRAELPRLLSVNGTLATQTRTRLPRPTATSEAGRKVWRLAGGLTIRELANKSGRLSYRLDVPAKVTGNRRLIQFKTFDEAEMEAANTLANKEQFGKAGFQLNRQEMDDALRALAILQPFAISLTKAAEYFARHERPDVETSL